MEQVNIHDIEKVLLMGDRFLEFMEQNARLPSMEKKVKEYRIGEVEKMLNKNRKTIIAAEEKGVISKTFKTRGGHRLLTLEQINQLRHYYELHPWRDARDEPIIIANVVTKGGVGKSVNSVTFSHAFAERGYRVLLIDLDPQATSTSTFGYIPDHHVKGPGKGIEDEMTIAPFMSLYELDLKYAIRDTNWNGLKLIPSNLSTYELEYSLISDVIDAKSKDDRQSVFALLRKGIDSVKQDFDIIFIDAPPSFGMIPLSILVASDALLIPSPARMYDFFSTIQFFRMVRETMETLYPGKVYKWMKTLITQYDHRMVDQQKFVTTMRKCFSDFPMNSIFYQAADIQKAASTFQSVFEFKGTQKKTLEMICPIVDELEGMIRSTWAHSPDQINLSS